jgi:hypothetical protein
VRTRFLYDRFRPKKSLLYTNMKQTTANTANNSNPKYFSRKKDSVRRVARETGTERGALLQQKSRRFITRRCLDKSAFYVPLKLACEVWENFMAVVIQELYAETENVFLTKVRLLVYWGWVDVEHNAIIWLRIVHTEWE